jgi:hypothetical protein
MSQARKLSLGDGPNFTLEFRHICPRNGSLAKETAKRKRARLQTKVRRSRMHLRQKNNDIAWQMLKPDPGMIDDCRRMRSCRQPS